MSENDLKSSSPMGSSNNFAMGKEKSSRNRSRSPRGDKLAKKSSKNMHYSHYYRDRFGSHSPEEYKNLRVANFSSRLDDQDAKRALEKELARRFKDFEVSDIYFLSNFSSLNL